MAQMIRIYYLLCIHYSATLGSLTSFSDLYSLISLFFQVLFHFEHEVPKLKKGNILMVRTPCNLERIYS